MRILQHVHHLLDCMTQNMLTEFHQPSSALVMIALRSQEVNDFVLFVYSVKSWILCTGMMEIAVIAACNT